MRPRPPRPSPPATGGGSLRRSTTRGFLWSFGSAGGQAILQIGSLAVLGHLLSPHEYGVVNASMLAVAFTAMLGQLGVAAAIVQKPDLTEKQATAALYFSIVTTFGARRALLDLRAVAEPPGRPAPVVGRHPAARVHAAAHRPDHRADGSAAAEPEVPEARDGGHHLLRAGLRPRQHLARRARRRPLRARLGPADRHGAHRGRVLRPEPRAAGRRSHPARCSRTRADC